MNQIFATALILALGLVAIQATTMAPTPIDVSTMCAGYTCEEGFCRVVGDAASCVACVPAGVDATCNSNAFWNTVLTSTMEDVACDEANVCPGGSTCTAGVCCYGQADATTEAPVMNTDMQCPTPDPQ